MNDNINDLPELNEEYKLSAEQVADYQRDGHILLKNIASPSELAVYRPQIVRTVKEHNTQTAPLSERDTYGKAFIQISNLWEVDPYVKRFVMARRFGKIAAELMGVSGVRMYHDQALFKEPGGGHTPWHQDQIYWPLDTSNSITLWMPLVPIPESVGTMTFCSGSYKNGHISRLEISDQSHKTLKEYIENNGLPTVNYHTMDAGDATFHAGWTLHSAPGNPSENMREVMTIIYVADQTRVLEPDSNARISDLKRWLPGLKPGDLIDSPLNPLVYSSIK